MKVIETVINFYSVLYIMWCSMIPYGEILKEFVINYDFDLIGFLHSERI